MVSFPLEPAVAARALALAVVRAGYSSDLKTLAATLPLHAAANAEVPRFSVIARYAFAMGRKKLPDVAAAAKAVGSALSDLLPKALVRAAVAGGRAASEEIRGAAFNPNQPRDEKGQWTAVFDSDGNELTPEEEFTLGGCVGFACALKEHIGGEIHTIDRGGKQYHAFVKKGDASYDVNGRRGTAGMALGIFGTFGDFEVGGPHKDLSTIKIRKPTDETISRARKFIDMNKGRFTVAASKPFTMKFDSTNLRIARWARKHAAELVVDIARTTLEQFRAVVARHADGTIDDADFSDALRAAVGDEARAETIARTETMRAVHAGQREAWNQAVDDGLLESTQKRVWIVTPDDRLCPQCEPYDGEEAALDGEYMDGVDGPPLHPNCRCTEGLQ